MVSLHGKLKQMVKLNIFIFSFFFNSIVVSNEIITIEIDGSNLPETKGEVLRGEEIFKENCSKCHGYSAEGLTAPELVGSQKLSGDNVSKTIGNFWPYAPKIFDFIKRAKRDKNDDYYSDEDVYSITGYILKINNLFEGKIIDKKKLSEIIMPNRDGFINFSN